MLWINATEKVSLSIGLEIGKDITQEKADELIALIEEDDEFSNDTKEYGILSNYLTLDYVTDSDGYEGVDIYIREEK